MGEESGRKKSEISASSAFNIDNSFTTSPRQGGGGVGGADQGSKMMMGLVMGSAKAQQNNLNQ